MAVNRSGIGLGDHVISSRHGCTGRVRDIHLTGCPEGEAWLRRQTPRYPPESLHGVWASVLVHGGGMVVVPIDDLAPVAAFPLDNLYAADFWPAA